MKIENKNKLLVPEPTVRRLSHYRYLLENLKRDGRLIVSSTLIANEMILDSIQVKKDIQFTGITGQPKKGYKINELLQAIDEILNWHKDEKAFLIGAGSLGHAMLGYHGFKECGLNFVAAFDTDSEKVGQSIAGVEVLELDRLVVIAKMMKVKIGVIAVPAPNAQKCADILIEGGIKAIWNFAPVRLKVPEHIIVENAQFTQSLAILTHKLGVSLKTKN